MATDRPALTVYSRKECHLCDEMIGALRRLQGPYHFDLAVVDVDGNRELERRHGAKVPVVMHGEREFCRYRLDTPGITAYLSNFR